MALSFSQGLLSSLTNPSFGGNLGAVGQQIGGLGGQLRANEQAEAEKKRMAQMAALEASGQGATEAAAQNRVNFQRSLLGDLGSTVSPQLAAVQQGAALRAGVSPQDVSDARALAPSNAGLAGRDRFVTAGTNVFDMQTGEWRTPPSKAEVSALTIKDAIELYKHFTGESVTEHLNDPSKPLVPITDQKAEEEKVPTNTTGKLLASDAIMGTIDQALQTADGVWGGTYDLTQFMPLTNARSLKGFIKTIDANLSFDRLQKMRDESKTGGALGQVSNIELELLKSSLSNLDPAAGGDVFINNLKNVRTHYNNFRRATLGLPPESDNYTQVGEKLYYRDPETQKWFDLEGQ